MVTAQKNIQYWLPEPYFRKVPTLTVMEEAVKSQSIPSFMKELNFMAYFEKTVYYTHTHVFSTLQIKQVCGNKALYMEITKYVISK